MLSLERIPVSALDSFFANAEDVIFVELNQDLTIQSFNRGFRKFAAYRNDLEQASFESLLLPESRGKLAGSGEGDRSAHLHFSIDGKGVADVQCRVIRTAEAVFILGEHITVTHSDVVTKLSSLNNDLVNAARALEREKRALEEANEHIKMLRGIIPICMYCKKIRNDQGYWDRLEQYIEAHSEGQFSHGICPQCLEKKLSGRQVNKKS